jgi:hypothetical protein
MRLIVTPGTILRWHRDIVRITSPKDRSWLMHELDGWDPRYALRAVMLAFPEPTSSLPSRTGQASRVGLRCPCPGRDWMPR